MSLGGRALTEDTEDRDGVTDKPLINDLIIISSTKNSFRVFGSSISSLSSVRNSSKRHCSAYRFLLTIGLRVDRMSFWDGSPIGHWVARS